MTKYRLATALVAALVALTLISITTVSVVSAADSSTAQIQTKEVSPYDMEGMLGGGEIDGVVAYEPWVTDMVQKNIGHILMRSNEIWPNHPSYVMLMDSTWAQRNPDLAARTVRAQMDAESWINESLSNPSSDNYSKLVDMAVQASGFSAKVVTEALKHINYSANITDQTVGYLANYTQGYLNESLVTNEMLQKQSYNTTQEFANGFVNLNYMQLASQVFPSSSILGKVSLGWAVKNIFMLPALVALNTSIWGGVSAFEVYGVQVTSPEPKGYNTSALVVQDLTVKDINVAYTAVCPAILSHLRYDPRSMMVAQVAAEGTAVVVSKQINSVSDLPGKLIATPGVVTIQHTFLHDFAQTNGMTVQEEEVETPVDQNTTS